MKSVRMIVTSLLFAAFAYGAGGKELAAKLGLSAGSKAIKQWERVFSKERKMKKLGIDKLSSDDKNALKEYLIGHAADSDHPAAAGL